MRGSLLLLLLSRLLSTSSFSPTPAQALSNHYTLKRGLALRAQKGTSESDDEVFVTMEELKAAWAAKGKPMSSFSEMAAIELLDDDDDDDGYVPVSSTNLSGLAAKVSPGRTASSTLSSAESAASTGKSVGIDLGTTYSSVSVIEGGIPKIIQIDDSNLVPSIVAYTSSDASTPLVGEYAKRQLLTNLPNTFSSIKRIIGLSIPQAKENKEKLLLLQVDANAPDVCTLKCPVLGSKRLLPEEISAELLRYLVKQASRHVGVPVTRAVITVPAYFKPSQIKATER